MDYKKIKEDVKNLFPYVGSRDFEISKIRPQQDKMKFIIHFDANTERHIRQLRINNPLETIYNYDNIPGKYPPGPLDSHFIPYKDGLSEEQIGKVDKFISILNRMAIDTNSNRSNFDKYDNRRSIFDSSITNHKKRLSDFLEKRQLFLRIYRHISTKPTKKRFKIVSLYGNFTANVTFDENILIVVTNNKTREKENHKLPSIQIIKDTYDALELELMIEEHAKCPYSQYWSSVYRNSESQDCDITDLEYPLFESNPELNHGPNDNLIQCVLGETSDTKHYRKCPQKFMASPFLHNHPKHKEYPTHLPYVSWSEELNHLMIMCLLKRDMIFPLRIHINNLSELSPYQYFSGAGYFEGGGDLTYIGMILTPFHYPGTTYQSRATRDRIRNQGNFEYFVFWHSKRKDVMVFYFTGARIYPGHYFPYTKSAIVEMNDIYRSTINKGRKQVYFNYYQYLDKDIYFVSKYTMDEIKQKMSQYPDKEKYLDFVSKLTKKELESRHGMQFIFVNSTRNEQTKDKKYTYHKMFDGMYYTGDRKYRLVK